MLRIYRGCPAVSDPVTGVVVVVFANNAKGWSKASRLVRDLREFRS